MQLTLQELARILNVPPPREVLQVTGLSFDSRTVKKGDLFCAVKGKKHDGHDFVMEAGEKGAVAGLVTAEVPANIPLLKVPSIETALAQIASWIRERVFVPVIGVTGSVGKTSTKEFIFSALSPFGPVLRSEGNLNTEYGLPQTWFQWEKHYRFVVLEMAMRGKGQIRALCEFSKPIVGVVTRIGRAHLGELGSVEAIVSAKAELLDSLPPSGVAILRHDEFLPSLREHCRCPVITFGTNPHADVYVSDVNPNLETGTSVVFLSLQGKRLRGQLPTLGPEQAVNASAAVATALALGLDVEKAVEALAHTRLPAGRLKLRQFEKVTILEDMYNSNPESCIEALNVFEKLKGQRKVVILGEMLELGDFSENLHRLVGAKLAEAVPDVIITIGNMAKWMLEEAIKRGFRGDGCFYQHVDEVPNLKHWCRPGDVVLIKGSRLMELEKLLWKAGLGDG